MLRLIERIGLRRQQVFATHADTVERLRNIAKLPELATTYMRREPQATARDFTRYLTAVAESGLREEEAVGAPERARRAGHDHARRPRGSSSTTCSCSGCPPRACPARAGRARDEVPDELLKERLPDADDRARCTRPRCAACCTWP